MRSQTKTFEFIIHYTYDCEVSVTAGQAGQVE